MTALRQAQQFLARRLGLHEMLVTPDCPRGIDAATRSELLGEVEREFGIRISHELDAVRTLGELVAAAACELAQHRARCAVQ
jgi:hypothetical protein